MGRNLEIDYPIHGTILHKHNGRKVSNGLEIDVIGSSSSSEPVYVNGLITNRDKEKFTTKIVLDEKENTITATSSKDMDTVRVILDDDESLRYSFSIDDNIFFLDDIYKKGYDSIFNNFYLNGLRNLHQKYGTKFTLNLFYKVDDRYAGTFGPFSLKQFPETYKGEWENNSDWLRLAFHAFSEFPNRPYQKASTDKIENDFSLLKKEIKRFAGEAYIPTSITHWAMLPQETFPKLSDLGSKVLCGYFVPNRNKVTEDDLTYDVNYCFDDKTSKFLLENKAVKDFRSTLVFCSLDLLFNATELNDIQPKLESILSNPKKKGVITLSTHEQYFWPQYKAPSSWFDDDSSGAMKKSPGMMIEYKNIPDHFERLDIGIKTVTEHGYKPVFLHESYNI